MTTGSDPPAFVALPASPGAGSPRTGVAPRAVEVIIYGALLGLAMVGLASPGEWSRVPAETILEGVFALATLTAMKRFDVAARSFLLVAVAYLLVKVALMAFGGGGAWLDFLQAYKAYFYLLALAFFIHRRLFDGRRLANVTAVLVAAFFVKYCYSRALHLDARPGLYDENNFELILLMGLFYVGFPYAGRLRHGTFLLVVATVLLSGSRSAAVALVVLYIGLYLRVRNPFWPLHVLGVAGVTAVVVSVFTRRASQGLQSIDRYTFLQTFLREVRSWPLWEFLTGSYPITPLSPGSCSQLTFYFNEFSHSQPGVCYAVILHSYLLRAVFDQGLLGLSLLYVLLWTALVRSGASRRDVIVLLGMMTVSGLSVSAFNNVFATITLAVALGLDRACGPEPVQTGGARASRTSPAGNPRRGPPVLPPGPQGQDPARGAPGAGGTRRRPERALPSMLLRRP